MRVRTYLRLLVGAPVRAADRISSAIDGFVESGARWSSRSEVDRRTLADLRVPLDVLDAAGISATAVAELVRRQYEKSTFTAADLVRKSGVSMASVRNTLAEDEGARLITRVTSKGRTIQYRLR
ncbi:MAG: hypothetical protein ACRDWE_11270 [Acidimicrobiales bacterium]